MFETGFFQSRETLQAVGVDRGAWCNIVFEKTEQSLASEVGDHGHARSSGNVSPTLLYGYQDQCSFPALQLTATPQPRLRATNPRIVDLHFAPERFAFQVDHRPPELV